MGRKVDIGDLSEEEQKQILEVINRDFNVRKAETERLGKIKQELKEKQLQVTTYDPVDPESACVICGAGFIWLFHPKVPCAVCKLFVCKNCPECRTYDKSNDLWLCLNCTKFRDLQAMSLDWYYSNLGSKFRRHGGAKILREFYKRRKEKGEAPLKPPRLFQEGSEHSGDEDNLSLSDSEKVSTNDDVRTTTKAQVREIQVQTTDSQVTTSSDQSEMRKQIEEVIATTILPKFEELKASQQKSRDEQPVVDQSTLADLIERLMAPSPTVDVAGDSESALMRRYLRDHKQSIIAAVLAKHAQQDTSQSGGLNSTRSSLRDAETMTTDASDSELESIRSGSIRSRSSYRAPLSERMRNLSPDSLRSALNAKQMSSDGEQTIVQGTLKKDQMIARAEVNSAMAEMLDVNEVDHDHEFSTELTFTAVSVQHADVIAKTKGDVSDTSENEDSDVVDDENWIIASNQQPQYQFLRETRTNPAFLPETDTPSAYDEIQAVTSSAYDEDDLANEEIIQPFKVTKSFTEVSATSLSSGTVEIDEPEPVTNKRRVVSELVADDVVDAIYDDLGLDNVAPPEQNAHSLQPIEEEPIVSRDRSWLPSSVVHATSAVVAFLSSGKGMSEDSAYSSDVSSQSHSEQNVKQQGYEESDAFMSGSSTDGSLRVSSKERSSILVPMKDNTRSVVAEKRSPTRLKSSDEIIVDNQNLDELFSTAIERQKEVEDQIEEDGGRDQSEIQTFVEEEHSDEISKRVRFAPHTVEVKEVAGSESSSDSEDDAHSTTTEEDYDVINRDDTSPKTRNIKKIDSQHNASTSELESESEIRANVSHAAEEEVLAKSQLHELEQKQDLQSDSRSSLYESESTEMEMRFSVVGAEMEEEKVAYSKVYSGRRIDEIVGELHHAGLQGETCKIKRSSISPRPLPAKENRAWKSETTSPKFAQASPTSPAGMDSQDKTHLHGFTVNPATYRKPEQSDRRSKSLMELLESDKLSSQENFYSTPRVVEVDAASEDKPVIQTEEISLAPLPTVSQRRSVFSDSNVTHREESKSMTSPISKNAAERVSSSFRAEESDSDLSSIVSSSTSKPGYDGDTSTMASDDESRSFSSPRPHDLKLTYPEVVIVENLPILEEVEAPTQKTEVRPSVKEAKQAFDLDRTSPVRGSITMRGRRMVAVTSPDKQNPEFRFEKKK